MSKAEFKKTILRRLKSVVKNWYQATENYHDLDEFLVSVNDTIQGLRNITFMLQKHGNLYEKFDEWYGHGEKDGIKRAEMRKNNSLRWIVEARNKIVKQGDLELFSVVFSSIENWRKLRLPPEVSPLLSNEELSFITAKALESEKGKKFLEGMGYPILKIERIWIEESNKEYEILSVLSYAYRYLKELIKEFSELAEIEWKEGELEIEPDSCIETQHIPEEKRVCIWDLKNNYQLSRKSIRVDFDEEFLKEAPKTFKIPPKHLLEKIKSSSPFESMFAHMEMAKAIVKTGQQHVPMLHIYGKDGLINFQAMHFEDRTQKYAMMNDIGEMLKKDKKITGLIFTNECWMFLDNPKSKWKKEWRKHVKNPNSNTQKTEAILIWVITNTGECSGLLTPFFRVDKSVVFEETKFSPPIEADLLNPIKEAWELKKLRARNEESSIILGKK